MRTQQTVKPLQHKAGIALRILLTIVLVSTMVILPDNSANADSSEPAATLTSEAEDTAATDAATEESGDEVSTETEATDAGITESGTEGTGESSTTDGAGGTDGADGTTGTTEDANQGTSDGAAAPTDEAEQQLTESALATLLADIAAAEDASAAVTLRAGDYTASATFKGGWLTDEANAWDTLSNYAAHQTEQGATRPAANEDFKPDVATDTLTAIPADGADATASNIAFAQTLFSAVIANNTYTSASIQLQDETYVLDENGNPASIIALGTINGVVHYILNSGASDTLTDGQTIVLDYSAPTDEQIAAAQTAADEAAAAAGETDGIDNAAGTDGAEGDAASDGNATDDGAETDATETDYADLKALLAAESESLDVMAKAEEYSSDATFAGGALVSEDMLRAMLPGYATEEATPTNSPLAFSLTSLMSTVVSLFTEEESFQPEVTLAEDAPEELQTSVNDGAYLASSVIYSDGTSEQILAAASVDGVERYATTDGSVKELSDGATIQLSYAAPVTLSDTVVTYADTSDSAITIPTYSAIPAGDNRIYKELNGSCYGRFVGFQGGSINYSTVPNKGQHTQYHGTATFGTNEAFRAAYVVIGASYNSSSSTLTGSRYLIDWVAKVGDTYQYRLQNSSADSGAAVLTSTLGPNDRIVFAYETGNQQSWTVQNGGSYSFASVNYLGQASYTILPATATGNFLVEANRPAGMQVWLVVEGGTVQGKSTELVVGSTATYGYRGTPIVDGSLTNQWTVVPNSNATTVRVTLYSGGPTTTVGVKVYQDVPGGGSGTFGVGSGTVTYPGYTNGVSVNASWSASSSSQSAYWPQSGNYYSWTRQSTLAANNFSITNLFNHITSGSSMVQQPVRMYIKYNDVQSGNPVTVNIPFMSSAVQDTALGYQTLTTTLTNGDLNGLRIVVTRQDSDNFWIGNTNYGYNHYSFEFANIKTTFEFHVVYGEITSDVDSNTRVAAVATDGVTATIRTMNGQGGTTPGISQTSFVAGNVYPMASGWSTGPATKVVRIDFTLQDDYYNPKVFTVGTGNTLTERTVTSTGSGSYYTTFSIEDSKTTSVQITTERHIWSVSKSQGSAASWNWPAGNPDYSGYVLTRDNSVLPISSSIPEGYDSSGNRLYFKGWTVQGNSVSRTFTAGQSVDMFNTSNVSVNGASNNYTFTLVAQWSSSPSTSDPINATYTIKKRTSSNGQETQDYHVLLAYNQEYNLSADNTITENSDTWILYNVEGGAQSGTFTGTLPTFVYEHVQQIQFTKDQGNSNDTSGANLGNIGVEGTDPTASDGLSFVQTAYVTRAGVTYDTYSEAQSAAATATDVYTADGYMMVGWRGVNSGTNYEFDSNGVATVPRAWGAMTLEPIWEQSHASNVVFRLNGPANLESGVSVFANYGANENGVTDGGTLSGDPTTEANQNRYIYPVDETTGTVTVPKMRDYNLSGQNNYIDAGLVDVFFRKGDTNRYDLETNYIAGWSTSENATTVQFAAGSTMNISDLVANGTLTESNEIVVDESTGETAYVLYPVWQTRAVDASITAPTAVAGTTVDFDAATNTIDVTIPRNHSDSQRAIYVDISAVADAAGIGFGDNFTPRIAGGTNTDPDVGTVGSNGNFAVQVMSNSVSGLSGNTGINATSWFSRGGATTATMNGSGTTRTAQLMVQLNAGKTSGTYSADIEVLIDGGASADGWHYRGTLAFTVNFTIEEPTHVSFGLNNAPQTLYVTKGASSTGTLEGDEARTLLMYELGENGTAGTIGDIPRLNSRSGPGDGITSAGQWIQNRYLDYWVMENGSEGVTDFYIAGWRTQTGYVVQPADTFQTLLDGNHLTPISADQGGGYAEVQTVNGQSTLVLEPIWVTRSYDAGFGKLQDGVYNDGTNEENQTINLDDDTTLTKGADNTWTLTKNLSVNYTADDLVTNMNVLATNITETIDSASVSAGIGSDSTRADFYNTPRVVSASNNRNSSNPGNLGFTVRVDSTDSSGGKGAAEGNWDSQVDNDSHNRVLNKSNAGTEASLDLYVGLNTPTGGSRIGVGTYQATVTLGLDAGDEAKGWTQTETITLNIVYNVTAPTYVAFSLIDEDNNNEGAGRTVVTAAVSASSKTTTTISAENEANLFVYELTNSNGSMTLGTIPTMVDKSNEAQGGTARRLVDITDTGGAENYYIAGWRTSTGHVVEAGDTYDSLLSEFTSTANGYEDVQDITLSDGSVVNAIVLEPIWTKRSFNVGFGVNGVIATGTDASADNVTMVNGATLTKQTADGDTWVLNKEVNPEYSASEGQFQLQVVADDIIHEATNAALSEGITLDPNKMQVRIVHSVKNGTNSAAFSGEISSTESGQMTLNASWSNGDNTNNIYLDNNETANITVRIPSSNTTAGNSYTMTLPIRIDAGPAGGGWYYTKTINLVINVSVGYNAWSFDIADVDYENERITLSGADASGASITGLSGYNTVPNSLAVDLASNLNTWTANGPANGEAIDTAATDEFETVTVRRDADDTHQEHSVSVNIPHRPEAPTTGEGGNVAFENAFGSENNGSITVTQRGTETYQYRARGAANWTAMTAGATAGTQQATGLDAGEYEVRVAPVDSSTNELEGTFASAAATVTIIREYSLTYAFDVSALTAEESAALVSDKLLTMNNTNAESVQAELFPAEGTELRLEDGTYPSFLRQRWNLLNTLMPGYTFTLRVESGTQSQEYTGSSAPSSIIGASGDTTITLIYKRSSMYMTYNYGFELSHDHMPTEIKTPTYWGHHTYYIDGENYTLGQVRANEGGHIGVPPLPTLDGWDWSNLEYWNTGYKFAGWWTQDGSTSGDWGAEVTSASLVSDVVPHGELNVTIYAKWVPVNYTLTGSASDSAAYNTTYPDVMAQVTVNDINAGGEGAVDARIREFKITSVTATPSGGSATTVTTDAEIANYFTLVTSEISDPTAINDGFDITVRPDSGLTPGVYVATVSVGYDGGNTNNSSLDLGGNVHTLDGTGAQAPATVQITFTVNAGTNAAIEFGTVDYEAETVEITGAQAPTTYADVAAMIAEGRFSISELPSGYIENAANWDDNNGAGPLKLKLTNALDTAYQEGQAAGWASDGGTVSMQITAQPENFDEATSNPLTLTVREAAPEQAVSSDPRAKGEGAIGTVTMEALSNANDAYVHRTAATDGGTAGTWQSMTGGVPTQFSAVAGDYQVRINGSNTTQRFASRIADVNIEQWYKVEIALSATDWQDRAIDLYRVVTDDGHSLGQQIGIYTGNGGMVNRDSNDAATNIFQLNANDRGWSDYQVTSAEYEGKPTDGVYNSMYVPAGAYYQLPVFGLGSSDTPTAGNWETPGYDLVSITQNTGTTDEQTIANTSDDAYAATRSNAINADTVVTLHFDERIFNVEWSVTTSESLTEKIQAGGSASGEVSPGNPTAQRIPWSEMVRTSLLGNLYETEDEWNAAETTSWQDWFVSSASSYEAIIDPVDISYIATDKDGNNIPTTRDTWALYTNSNTRVGFQVAQRLDVIAQYDPTTHMTSSTSTASNKAPTSWRDADTITFNAQYSDDVGVYGVRFKIAPSDQELFTIANEDSDYRLSVALPKSTPIGAEVRSRNETNLTTTGSDMIIPGTNHVFSGWYVDPDESSGLVNEATNADGEFYNGDYDNPEDNLSIQWSSEPTDENGDSNTTETLLNRIFDTQVEYADAGGTNVDAQDRPFPFVASWWNTEYATTGGTSGSLQYYYQHFPLWSEVPDTYDASKANTFPMESRVDVTARIENTELNATHTLPAVSSTSKQDATLLFDLAEPWLGTEAATLTSETAPDAATNIGFKVLSVEQVGSTTPNGDGVWLTVDTEGLSTADYVGITQDSASGAVTSGTQTLGLSVAENLANGDYSTTLRVTYAYRSSNGTEYDGADGNQPALTMEIPISYTVGNSVTSDNTKWMATAHDYVTTYDAAARDLTDGASIAKAMGLTVYHNTGTTDSPNWVEISMRTGTDMATDVNEDYTLTVNPSAYGTVDWVYNPQPITFTITGHERDVAGENEDTFTYNRNSITLYDGGGTIVDNIAVFANNVDMTLPTKDENYTSATNTNSVAYLVSQMGVAAYNVGEGYTPIQSPTFTITDDSSLSSAGPTNVQQDDGTSTGGHTFNITFSHGRATGTAAVTLIKADYPGAPGAFSWTSDASTATSASWTAAPLHESPTIATQKGYAPTVAYRVTNSGTQIADVATTQATGLNSNTAYEVSAFHNVTGNSALVYDAIDWTNPAHATTITDGVAWTLPANPTETTTDITYDYNAETVAFNPALATSIEQGMENDGSQATITLSSDLTGTSVADLAGVQAVSGRTEGNDGVVANVGRDSGTFYIRSTGEQSGLVAANDYTVTTVPQRAATPYLSIAQPTVSTDPAVISGFDSEYVAADGTSLYQVSIDGGSTWGSLAIDAATGTPTLTDGGYLTLDTNADGAYTFEIPATYTGNDLRFRVAASDAEYASAAGTTAAHFESGAQITPANGGNFNVTVGSYLSANNFTVGLNELTTWGFDENTHTFADLDSFNSEAITRSAPQVQNPQDGLTYALDEDFSGLRLAEGAYTITWNLIDESNPSVALSSTQVTMTVKSYYDPGSPNASLSANDFVISMDDLAGMTAVADMKELAWSKSDAAGVNTNGTVALTSDDVDFSIEGVSSLDEVQPTGANNPYMVRFTNYTISIDVPVNMYVYDTVVEGTDWAIASNDFTAGENEVATDATGAMSLTQEMAAARAGVTLFHMTGSKDPVTVVVTGNDANVTVDIADLANATVANSPVVDGAEFAVVAEPATIATSDVTILNQGTGSEDGQYQIAASNVVTDTDSLSQQATDGTALLFSLAKVAGVNNGSALVAGGYGTTWTVSMTPSDSVAVNSANTNANVNNKSTWTKGVYDLTFSLMGSADASAYSVEVTMTVYDSGSTGEVDGTTYYIGSNDFDMAVSDYDAYFAPEDGNYSTLFNAADVAVYRVEDNGSLTPTNSLADVQVDLTDVAAKDNFVAGMETGPAVFYLGATSADTPRAESMIQVHGDYVDAGNYTLAAENFVISLDALAGVEPGTEITGADLTTEGNFAVTAVDSARFTITPENATTLMGVTPGTADDEWVAGGVYPVTFRVDAATNNTVTVNMTVFDNITPANGYIIASNDFRATEEEAASTGDASLSAQQLRERGGVTVYNSEDLQTPIASYETSADSIAVYDGDFRDRKVGEAAQVEYRYQGYAAFSDVTIYPNGGGSQSGTLALFASDIVTSTGEIANNASRIGAWLVEKAGVVGTTTAGTPVDTAAVTSSITTADAVTDGTTVTFTYVDTAAAGSPQITADAQISVYDNGGEVTDSTGVTYGIYSNNFNASIAEGAALADSTNNYETLRGKAGVVGYTKTATTPTIALTAEQIGVDATQAAALENAYDGAQLPVTFTNLLSEGKTGAAGVTFPVTSVSTATFFETGGSEGGTGDTDEWELYASSFQVDRSELTGSDATAALDAAAVETLIKNNSRVVWGPNTADAALTTEINTGTTEDPTWMSVATFMSGTSFDNWARASYDVRFTYTDATTSEGENPSVTITMGVVTDYDTSGTVEVSANDFTVSLAEVNNGTIDDYRQQLMTWAGVEALDKKVDASERVVVTLGGETVAADKPSTWPTAKGTQTVTFSISEADGAGTGTDGAVQTATATVTMTVVDNGSNDPIDPEEEINPQPGANYKVVSNNFRLSIEEVQAGKTSDGSGFTTDFQQTLIAYAEAKAFLTDNLTVPSGTVTVADASELMGTLTEGDTVRVAFGVEGDSAQSVSTVTLYASGSQHPDADNHASIYANDIYTWKNEVENPTSYGYASLDELLVTLAGVNATDATGAALTGAAAFQVTVVTVDENGAVVTSAEPSATNVVDGAKVRFTHATPITLPDGSELDAIVTVHVSDSGDETYDPDTNTTYRMQSDNLSWLASDVDTLRATANNYEKLRAETQARASSQVDGEAAVELNGADASVLNVDASALGAAGSDTLPVGTYDVVYTNTASASTEVRPQSTSKITLFDQGGVDETSQDYLWANNFAASKTDLDANAADVHDFIYTQAGVSAGNEVTGEVTDRKQVTIEVNFGGTWTNITGVADLTTLEAFDNWAHDSYQVRMNYGDAATVTVTMTVRDTGSNPGGTGDDAKASIYADSFTVGLAQIQAQNTEALLGAYLYGTNGAKVVGTDTTGVALPSTWNASMVGITVDGMSLADAAAGTWALDDYTVVFTVLDGEGNATSKVATVTMSVREQADQSTDGLVQVAANSFSTAVETVAANESKRAEWVWTSTQAAGSVDGVDVDFSSPEVSIQLGGMDIDAATWPTAKGVYPVTITVERQSADADTIAALAFDGGLVGLLADSVATLADTADAAGAEASASDQARGTENTASVTVNMIVYDNSSEDTDGDGNDPDPIPDPSDTHVVFSRDFAVALHETTAGGGSITNDELVSRSGAVVFAQNNLATPVGAAVVSDRSQLDNAALQAGDVVEVAFQNEDGTAQAVSNVTIYEGGSSNPGDPTDPTDDASIYANGFTIGRNELPDLQAMDSATFISELLARGEVAAMLNSADVTPSADNVNVYIGGTLVSTAADVNWNLDTQTVEFRLKDASGAELASASVTMQVRDSSSDPDSSGSDQGQARILANDFITARDIINATDSADLTVKFATLAQVIGKTAAGAALDVSTAEGAANIVATIDGTPVADVTDWSADSYQVTFAVADDPTVAVTVTMTLRDSGMDPSTPGTVNPSDPGAGDEIAAGTHASIYANNFAVDYPTGLEPNVDVLADFLYTAAGIVGTNSDGSDLAGAGDVTIAVDRQVVTVDAAADSAAGTDASTGTDAAASAEAATAATASAQADTLTAAASATASTLSTSLLTAAPSTAMAASITPTLNRANIAALGPAIMIDGVPLADVVAGMRDGSWQWQNGYYPVSFAVADAPQVSTTVWMEVSGVVAQAADAPVADTTPAPTTTTEPAVVSNAPKTGDSMLGIYLALTALGVGLLLLLLALWRRRRASEEE